MDFTNNSSNNCSQIHPTAIVEAGAQLGNHVRVGPYSIIGAQVSLGDRVRIHEHVVIQGNTQIAEDCQIHPFASLGQQAQDKKTIDGKSNGLRIGPRTVIREFVSIHTAAKPSDVTTIGSDCFIMGQVHVAHDCQIGNRVVISQGSGLAGCLEIHDDVVIGGMAGIHQFVRIGKMSMIGAMSGIGRDVLPYSLVTGNRAFIVGANLIGLRRNGLYHTDRLAIQKALRMITMSTALPKTLEELNHIENAHVQHILEFIQHSRRGFTGGRHI